MSSTPLSLALALSLPLALAACDSEPPFGEGSTPRLLNLGDIEDNLDICGTLTCGGAGNTPEFFANELLFEFSLGDALHKTTEGHGVLYEGAYHPEHGPLDIAVAEDGTLQAGIIDPNDTPGLRLRLTVDGKLRQIIVDSLVETPAGFVYDLREVTRTGDVPLCPVDQYGNTYAFMYGGFQLYTQPHEGMPAGKLKHDPDLVHIGCTSSATGKASLFGFRPEVGDADSLGAFEAALRGVRLELCGGGVSQTVPGATVILNDRQGVMQPPYDFVDQLEREAGFTRAGAVCWDGVVRDGAEVPTCEQALALPTCDEYLALYPNSALIETYLPGA